MTMIKRSTVAIPVAMAVLASGLVVSGPAAAQFRQRITNDMSRCEGAGPAVRVTVAGISAGTGIIRVQSYHGVASEWMQSGRWLTRTEAPARRGTMVFCVPVSAAGTYAIAVRHDANGNGKTDLSSDGGGMSNNPSINIFNLGKPSVSRTAFTVGNEVKAITINLRYM